MVHNSKSNDPLKNMEANPSSTSLSLTHTRATVDESARAITHNPRSSITTLNNTVDGFLSLVKDAGIEIIDDDTILKGTVFFSLFFLRNE